MHFSNLESVSTETLKDAFNYAFSDYEIPLHFESEAFTRKLKVENYNSSLSVGAFDENNQLVGFIMHSNKVNPDEKVIYNGGTGVIPTHRGKGITKQLYQFFFQEIMPKDTQKVILEVLSNNTPAYKSYVASGFVKARSLSTIKGTPQNTTKNHKVESVDFDQISIEELLQMNSITPTWQNDFQAMQFSKDFIEIFVVKHENRVVGYLIYNTIVPRIHQIAVHPDFRNQGIGSSLLAHLVSIHPKEMTLINIEDTETSLLNFFQKHGFKEIVTLDELICQM